MHIPLCRYINTYVYIYTYIYIYVRYCITIIHSTEPQATSPTGNRAKGNHSYRQPVCIHREVTRGPWRIPGGSLEGPCISQCCVFQRFERILRNLWRVPRGSPVESSLKVPCSALFSKESEGSEGSLMQTLFSSVVQIIAGTSVSAPCQKSS